MIKRPKRKSGRQTNRNYEIAAMQKRNDKIDAVAQPGRGRNIIGERV